MVTLAASAYCLFVASWSEREVFWGWTVKREVTYQPFAKPSPQFLLRAAGACERSRKPRATGELVHVLPMLFVTGKPFGKLLRTYQSTSSTRHCTTCLLPILRIPADQISSHHTSRKDPGMKLQMSYDNWARTLPFVFECLHATLTVHRYINGAFRWIFWLPWSDHRLQYRLVILL